ncbi:MAG: AraC family transcriptional regulator ligand-binding domain-containing protein [Halioglobus sp.]
MYDISPVYARFVLRDLLQRKVPEERLFAETSLSRESLELGGNISKDDFVTFLNNARRHSGDEQLGLLIGKHSNIIALGPVGAAVATAPTIREGLQILESFARLHASYMQVALISNLSGLSIQIGFLSDTGETERFHAETAIMLVQHYVETVTGQKLDDAAYQFAFDAPPYASQYAQWLHSPVSFNHTMSSVELSQSWLDKRSPYFNDEIWQQAQLLLAQRIRELGTASDKTYTTHLYALMQSHEPPLPDLGAVAARLHVSERTLNRRLQQEKTSFRQIRAEVLGHWAQQYLTQTQYTVEAISAVLGYQDAANFRRAFRAQQGCSPSEYRRQHSTVNK